MSDREPIKVSFLFEGEDVQRLDKFLVSCLPELSRSRIQKLIKDGNITLDGQAPRKAGQLLERRTIVQALIPTPSPSELIPEDIPLDIVFENEDLLVVNKPAGMVVHPAAGHPSGTLVQAALAHAPEMEGVGGIQRPGVVHRLDKNTSGLILLAKNDLCHRWLQDQFRTHKVQKTYIALVDGKPPTPTGRIDTPIGRDTKIRQKMAVVTVQRGRRAISEYHTLENFQQHSLLEIHPITGRTHQIRLHLAFLDCPIAGDTIYGKRISSIPLERHFLHAARLSVQLPGEKEQRTFEAPIPRDLMEILERLRRSTNSEESIT